MFVYASSSLCLKKTPPMKNEYSHSFLIIYFINFDISILSYL